jgi:hypothetical protein
MPLTDSAAGLPAAELAWVECKVRLEEELNPSLIAQAIARPMYDGNASVLASP